MMRAKRKKKNETPQTQIGGEVNDKKTSMDERRNNRGSSILQGLVREVEEKMGFTKALINPAGELSLSDAISNIIAPYRHIAQDYQSFYKLVTIACAAWNATVLPAEERKGMLADMRKLMPDQQSREDFVEIVKDLMRRKNKLYPNVNRVIIQFKVTKRRNDFHIAIVSTMENKEPQ
jgi:pyruvate/oxaloacetate carboxyltransferase